MPCPDFEKKAYLYLSEELSHSETEDFKDHLKECAACRSELEKIKNTLSAINRLSLKKPRRKTRNFIINRAREKLSRTPLIHQIQSWINESIPRRCVLWGLPTTAVVLLLRFLLIHPFDRTEFDQTIQKQIFEWEDDIIIQANWIDNEIDRIESGELLVSYFSREDESSEYGEALSPMSDDLNWIREKVEDLMTTMHEI